MSFVFAFHKPSTRIRTEPRQLWKSTFSSYYPPLQLYCSPFLVHCGRCVTTLHGVLVDVRKKPTTLIRLKPVLYEQLNYNKYIELHGSCYNESKTLHFISSRINDEMMNQPIKHLLNHALRCSLMTPTSSALGGQNTDACG